MRLQTYEVLEELNFLADVGGEAPMKVGQVVYEWPYPTWNLCGPDDIPVVLTPMEVATVYAMPRSALKQGPLVDLTLTVRDGMSGLHLVGKPA